MMSARINTETGDAASFARYYRELQTRVPCAEFKNLDLSHVLNESLHRLKNPMTSNFMVDFSDDTAWAAFDLSSTSVDRLLHEGGPKGANARWINIWYPYAHRPLLESLAKHYDFSPRLLALMGSSAVDSREKEHSDVAAQPQRSFWLRRRDLKTVDPEVAPSTEKPSFDTLSTASRESLSEGNLYRLVHDLWHYTSMDLGRTYVCLGYNSLYPMRSRNADGSSNILPFFVRAWTWLILCDDSTVITINEDIFPSTHGQLSHEQHHTLCETRHNLINVFRSLSLVESSPFNTRNPMTLFPIRTRLGHTPEETAHRGSDAPGLLLYYLFENWHNSYNIVARRESRYGVELATIRSDMFSTPKLQHIDRLDSIGRELGVLKRHYQSHTRLIARLLEPQGQTTASLDNSRMFEETAPQNFGHRGETDVDVVVDSKTSPVLPVTSVLGVSISSAARARFKRLKDLIELYALSEIDEYLKQKDALVSMNFSLIAIKESLDVERLTRITLLLTKATFLFLPVSFMTAYFSVQLRGVEYTVREYWTGFAVTLFLSWVAMFVFGVFSGDVSTALAMRQFWRGLKRFALSLRK